MLKIKMEFLQGVITGIRNIRGEMNISPAKKLKVLLKTTKLDDDQVKYIKSIARIDELNYGRGC